MTQTSVSDKIVKSDEEWKEELSPEAFYVCRLAGTERAFTGKLLNEKRTGIYSCAACGQDLFKSATKFDSGSGWPSFFEPIEEGRVTHRADHSHGMVRTEALCSRCDSHLGHVFPDGPPPTGQRYCMNSVSLDFKLADD